MKKNSSRKKDISLRL